jgi:hypothetical protein
MDQNTSQAPTFHARLTEAGLAVEDSSLLCREYAQTGDWQEVRRRALEENLLSKGSQARISKLLRVVERRVIQAGPPLSCPPLLARFLASRAPGAAKAQLLFVLAVREDAALAEAYGTLVVPALTGSARRAPTKPDIFGFLEQATRSRPEVVRWTQPTRLRWAEGFRLVLREVGMMRGSSRNHEAVQPPVVREETVCFLCHAVADRGVSGWPILRHDVLRLLLPTEGEAIRAARTLQDRGWWTFAQNGALVEFRRHHTSLEDWINNVLGS